MVTNDGRPSSLGGLEFASAGPSTDPIDMPKEQRVRRNSGMGSYDLSSKTRREIANSNERRRMQNINVGFDQLKNLLPDEDFDKTSKISKATILQASANFIESLIVFRSALEKENKSLRQRLSKYEGAHVLTEDSVVSVRRRRSSAPPNRPQEGLPPQYPMAYQGANDSDNLVVSGAYRRRRLSDRGDDEVSDLRVEMERGSIHGNVHRPQERAHPPHPHMQPPPHHHMQPPPHHHMQQPHGPPMPHGHGHPMHHGPPMQPTHAQPLTPTAGVGGKSLDAIVEAMRSIENTGSNENVSTAGTVGPAGRIAVA